MTDPNHDAIAAAIQNRLDDQDKNYVCTSYIVAALVESVDSNDPTIYMLSPLVEQSRIITGGLIAEAKIWWDNSSPFLTPAWDITDEQGED